jgi:hypothetical protein
MMLLSLGGDEKEEKEEQRRNKGREGGEISRNMFYIITIN